MSLVVTIKINTFLSRLRFLVYFFFTIKCTKTNPNVCFSYLLRCPMLIHYIKYLKLCYVYSFKL